MTPASRMLGRRIRQGYGVVCLLILCGLLIAGVQIRRVLGEDARDQRVLGLAARQTTTSQRAMDLSNDLLAEPNPDNRLALAQAIKKWDQEAAFLEDFMKEICIGQDPLCSQFEALKTRHKRLEAWFHERTPAPPTTDMEPTGRVRHPDVDAYSEAVDDWTDALARRLTERSIRAQHDFFLWNGVLGLLAVCGAVVVLEPTIRRLQAERTTQDQLTDAREEVAAVAERTHHAVFLTDVDGRVKWANAAFLSLAQRPLAQITGMPIAGLLAARTDATGLEDDVAARLARGEGFQIELRYADLEGTPRWGAVDCRPVVDDGRIRAFFGIESDVSERKLGEALVARQKTMLAATSAIAGVGGWEMDLLDDTMEWSDMLFRLHDLPVGRPPPLEQVRSLFPGDAWTKLEAMRTAALERGESTDAEVRGLTATGRERWFRVVITPQRQDGRLASLIGAVQDITESKQITEALRLAKDEADAASAAKGYFLANMSHEIRTPLNGVIGMTGLLLDTPMDAQQREYAQIARSSGESLLGLINDILDLSKIESSQLELEHIDFDCRQLIDEAVDAVALRAAEKRLEILVDVESDCPSACRGDPTRLRQVLINLLSNAVKFTDHGDVELSVRATAESAPGRSRLRFEVRDSGIGIEAAAIPRLFSPFTQADSSTTRRHGGTGLGLAISRRLVNAMDGDIRVTSSPGRGSTFDFDVLLEPGAQTDHPVGGDLRGLRALIVDDHALNLRILAKHLEACGIVVVSAATAGEAIVRWDELAGGREARCRTDPILVILDHQLPDHDGLWLAAAIRDRDPIHLARLMLLTSLTHQFTADERHHFQRIMTKPIRGDALLQSVRLLVGDERPIEALPAPASALSGRRILLVDDNAVNRKLAGFILAKLGVDVTLAGNGLEALERLREARFDAVLMDCQMPEMDGYEASRRIRDGSGGVLDPGVPIIALTANALSGDRERCLAAGMDSYLTKPLDAARLPPTIREAIAQAAVRSSAWCAETNPATPRPGPDVLRGVDGASKIPVSQSISVP